MTPAQTRVVDGGRVLVPAAFRRAIGLEIGDAVLIELRGDELVLTPAKTALRRIQSRLRPYATERSIVDELIEDRRTAAGRE